MTAIRSLCVARSPEAPGIVNRGCEGECGELANTGNAHQPAASVGCPGHPSYVPVDRHDGGARGNQASHGGGQAGDAPSLAPSACLM